MPKGSGRTKNLRYGAGEGLDDDLFDAINEAASGLDVDNPDAELLYEVDMDNISADANTMAASNVQNLLRLYQNKEFIEEHPDFKRRIDTEIESLRRLYKMSKTDEVVHDHLVHAISRTPGNASLYKALDYIQGKMLSIDQKIRDQIQNFNKIITSYQLEMTFKEDNRNDGDGHTSELEDGSVMSRGSKSFIEQMKQNQQGTQRSILDEPGVTEELDLENLPAGWVVDEEYHEVVNEETGECIGRVEDGKFIKY